MLVGRYLKWLYSLFLLGMGNGFFGWLVLVCFVRGFVCFFDLGFGVGYFCCFILWGFVCFLGGEVVYGGLALFFFFCGGKKGI